MRCTEVRCRLDQVIEGTESPVMARRVRDHLSACPVCKREWELAERLHAALAVWRTSAAPAGFGERVLAAAAALPAPSPWGPGMRVARRLLLFGGPLSAGAAMVALLLLTPSRPARALQETLDAMSTVRTAHAVGTLADFFDRDRAGKPLRREHVVEYWYAAPHRVRQHMEGVPGGGIPEQDLYLLGGEAWVSRSRMPAVLIPMGSEALLHLSAFSFLARGVLAEPIRHRGNRVEERTTAEGEREFHVVSTRGPVRDEWWLRVSPATRRVSSIRVQASIGGPSAWRVRQIITLPRIEYDVVLQPGTFVVPGRANPQR